jgi:hypothetical protein
MSWAPCQGGGGNGGLSSRVRDQARVRRRDRTAGHCAAMAGPGRRHGLGHSRRGNRIYPHDAHCPSRIRWIGLTDAQRQPARHRSPHRPKHGDWFRCNALVHWRLRPNHDDATSKDSGRSVASYEVSGGCDPPRGEQFNSHEDKAVDDLACFPSTTDGKAAKLSRRVTQHGGWPEEQSNPTGSDQEAGPLTNGCPRSTRYPACTLGTSGRADDSDDALPAVIGARQRPGRGKHAEPVIPSAARARARGTSWRRPHRRPV